MAPPIVVLLLAAIGFFLFLTLGARNDPERKKQFYLFMLIDLWLVGVFLYLLISAVFDW